MAKATKTKWGSMGGPTPQWAKTVRNIALKAGGALVAIGGAVIALPAAGVAIPVAIATYAGYAVAYGTAITTLTAAISQAFHEVDTPTEQ